MSCQGCGQSGCTGGCSQKHGPSAGFYGQYGGYPYYSHAQYWRPKSCGCRPQQTCSHCQEQTSCDDAPKGQIASLLGRAAPTTCDPCGCTVSEPAKDMICRVLAGLEAGGQASGSTLLIGADCKKYTVATGGGGTETPLTVVDTSSVDLTASGTAGHTLQAVVRVSATPGNAIVTNPDGLFVPDFCTSAGARPVSGNAVFGQTVLLGRDCNAYVLPVPPGGGAETPLTVIDSPTVDLTSTGTAGHTVRADVNIAPNQPGGANQIVVIPGQGIYVPPAPAPTCSQILGGLPVGSPGVAGTSFYVGPDCQQHLLPSSGGGGETANSATDTSSVDLTLTGPFNRNIQADARLAPAQPGGPNQIVVIPGQGLYAPPAQGGTETPLTVVDSATVDLTSSGTAGHTLTASVVVSPSPSNTLVAQPNGLFVPPATCAQIVANIPTGPPGVAGVSFYVGDDCQRHLLPASGGGGETANSATDTSTVDITLSGPFNRNIQADVQVAPAQGGVPNAIVVVPGQGLYATVPAQTPVTVVDSSTVNLTASGTDNHTVTAVVNVSGNAGNQVTVQGDGLFVPDPCVRLNGLPNGPQGVPGVDRYVGPDCQVHLLPSPFDLCAALNDLPVSPVPPLVLNTLNLVTDNCNAYAFGISSDQCNILGQDINGRLLVLAPPGSSSPVAATTVMQVGVGNPNLPVEPARLVLIPRFCLSVTNTDPCRTRRYSFFVYYKTRVWAVNGNNWVVSAQLNIGTPSAPAGGPTDIIWDMFNTNGTAGEVDGGTNGQGTELFIDIAPGQTASACVEIFAFLPAGSPDIPPGQLTMDPQNFIGATSYIYAQAITI